ncbi:hypothetical protein [Bacillus sp. REN3]|uniref:hypothetical protein n=1 Tax=Bacillus sp. REN3 TaxID=2802440 RepID=UPI001FEE2A9D|nr:hypothetical protein [Bacillus sp. REN3]
MNNLQRLELETKGIQLQQDELTVYLQENDLQPFVEYDAQSATNKKNIYRAALSVLESIANNPTGMKSYKMDDMTVSDFHENLMIDICSDCSSGWQLSPLVKALLRFRMILH